MLIELGNVLLTGNSDNSSGLKAFLEIRLGFWVEDGLRLVFSTPAGSEGRVSKDWRRGLRW